MRRRVVVLLVAVLVVLAGCGKDKKDEAEEKQKESLAAATSVTEPVKPAANCVPVPAPGPTIAWLPADLPMPPGTYAVQELTVSPPSKGAVFVVPGSIQDYVKFALAEFPKAGFRLGRGDAEADEAEDSFSRGNSAGAFRARRPYCDTAKTELQLTYVADLQAAKTTTTT